MMREPEKMAFEDRVLAYLDGALDDASSDRLLGEIASDPEKAEIFAGHQGLDKLIMTSRVPLETPEETRRSIVAAIPGLTTYLPEFITTGTGVGLVASRWRTILDFFTQTPLRTALSIGGAAAVVTTGVVVTKNIADKHADRDIVAKSRIERVMPVAPSTTPQFAMPNTSTANTPSVARSSNAMESDRSGNSASTHSSSRESSLADRNVRNSQNTGTAIPRTVRNSNAANERSANADVANANSANPRGANANVANRHSANANGEIANAVNPEPPLDDISATAGHMIGDALQQPQLRNNHFEPFYHDMNVYRTPLGVTVTAGFGTRVIFTPPVDGQAQPVDVSTPFSASIRYAMSDAMSLIAEGGNASFMRIRQVGSLEQSFGSLQHYRITTQLLSDNAVWTRIGGEYQLSNDAWAVTPFVNATVGAAFMQHVAPTVGVSVGAKWYWTDAVKLIGGVGYDQTWTRRDRDFTVPESAIVDKQEMSGGTVSNSALTINLGISTTF